MSPVELLISVLEDGAVSEFFSGECGFNSVLVRRDSRRFWCWLR
ncbi:unnamed protein product [Arabidopsis halleri]